MLPSTINTEAKAIRIKIWFNSVKMKWFGLRPLINHYRLTMVALPKVIKGI